MTGFNIALYLCLEKVFISDSWQLHLRARSGLVVVASICVCFGSYVAYLDFETLPFAMLTMVSFLFLYT